MLRYRADLKTLLWMSMSTALFFYQWHRGEVLWWLYIPYLYFAVCFSVIAHNHNHLPMWKNKYLNLFTDIWVTLFYGFPVFAWLPTHNANHHRHNNKEPDYTRTYMVSERNNLLTLLVYPFISGRSQQGPVFRFFKKAWTKNRERAVFYTLQIVFLVAFIAVTFSLDWWKALIFVVIPQQVSLNTVLVFNYVQHIHADEESKYNHSRNIVGWALNFSLFNNGYHTVHHLYPMVHWSKTKAKHKEIDHLIDPALKEQSFLWYILRVYILGIFVPKFRTPNMRRARMDRERLEGTDKPQTDLPNGPVNPQVAV